MFYDRLCVRCIEQAQLLEAIEKIQIYKLTLETSKTKSVFFQRVQIHYARISIRSISKWQSLPLFCIGGGMGRCMH